MPESPCVVLGASPLARALAAAWGRDGPTTLAAPEPLEGPFLWRRVSWTTGEGLAAVLRNAQRVCVVLHGIDADLSGVTAGLARTAIPGATVHLVGQAEPPGWRAPESWPRLGTGPCWGPEEPLIATWRQQAANGQRLWVTDAGPLYPISMATVRSAVDASIAMGTGATWTLLGAEARFADLATVIGARALAQPQITRVPLSLMAWRASVPRTRLASWLGQPGPSWHTPGWSAPPPVRRLEWTR